MPLRLGWSTATRRSIPPGWLQEKCGEASEGPFCVSLLTSPGGEGTCDGAQLDAVPRRLLDQVAPRPTRKELVLAGKNRRPPAAPTED